MNFNDDIDIEGVEVNSIVNRYLPNNKMQVVKGTWDLCSEAQNIDAWLFVYPRSPDLLTKYFDRYQNSFSIQRVIWIGPNVDWEFFKVAFNREGLHQQESVSLTAFETMVVFEVQ
jgi:hypothetical protein